MKRVSVDIGGTFTDCFVVWDDRLLQTKATTTHHNLALGFNEALDLACTELGLTREKLLSEVDSVRYATTLGTNVLIERTGPRIGLLITEGFESTVPLSRGRGYAEGLTLEEAMDLSRGTRPEPLVPPNMIRGIQQRRDYAGSVIYPLNEDDLRLKIRELVDENCEALVVSCANSPADNSDEKRIREIFLDEYPSSLLGAVPIVLGSEVVTRSGEYARTTSAIIDAYLHPTMYFGVRALEENLRSSGYQKPVLLVHNTGGMAQPNSTDGLRTVHSGPVAGVHAAESLAANADLGQLVSTDMGGTSFDIGIVGQGGIKHYDFNPIVDRWMIALPMVHLATLGSGGGSIATYDPIYQTVKVGPRSAGSDPGPACYDRGGLNPTVTDADLLLGYLDPEQYASGRVKLNERRSVMAMEELADELDMAEVEVAKLIKRHADIDMARGMARELGARGYRVEEFTMLAFGGNGPLHCCGIADSAKVKRVLIPPFAQVFSAMGASSLSQLHFHEHPQIIDLYNPLTKTIFDDFALFNDIVAGLEDQGRDDLLRQGVDPAKIQTRLELDMRYGSQRVETTVVSPAARLESRRSVLEIIERHSKDFGNRFGDGSQAPESGVRVETIRVASYVPADPVVIEDLRPESLTAHTVEPVGTKLCHYVGFDDPVETLLYDKSALERGSSLSGPAIIAAGSSTYLVEPGWSFQAAGDGAAWLHRVTARPDTELVSIERSMA